MSKVVTYSLLYIIEPDGEQVKVACQRQNNALYLEHPLITMNHQIHVQGISHRDDRRDRPYLISYE